MTVEEIKGQLTELIEDRKSHLHRVKEEDYIYERDIEALEYAIERLDNIAHWDINCDGYYPFCSACGESPMKMSKYCPNCGSRMITRKGDST